MIRLDKAEIRYTATAISDLEVFAAVDNGYTPDTAPGRVVVLRASDALVLRLTSPGVARHIGEQLIAAADRIDARTGVTA